MPLRKKSDITSSRISIFHQLTRYYRLNHKYMNARELRIGNILYFGEPSIKYPVYFHIEGGHSIQAVEGGIDVRPIPLTEAWLIKLGFEKGQFVPNQKNNICYSIEQKKSDDFIIVLSNSEFYLGIDGSLGVESAYNPIEHVYQLQNLYFALTCEELTIKESGL